MPPAMLSKWIGRTGLAHLAILALPACLLVLATGCAVAPAPASTAVGATAAPAAAPATPAAQAASTNGSLFGPALPPAAYSPPPATGYPPPGANCPPPTVAGYPPPGPAGVVPIGAADTAPVGRDVVPVSLTTPAPGDPGAPGGPTAGGIPEPIVASPAAAAKPKSDDDDGWDISNLAPDKIWKNMRAAAGYGPDEKIARAAFQEGLALMRQKKFDEAAAKFDVASDRWPDSTLEEDSLFLLGECYFFADRYSKAYDAYANLLKKRDNTRHLDTVMLRQFLIGRYWDQMDVHAHHWPITPNFTDKTLPLFDTGGNAVGSYEQVRLHDPTGPLADSAVKATADYEFRNGHWEEAAGKYDDLRQHFPKSRFQKDAHILGLQSVMRIYQGPCYYKGPLDRAKDIADQTLTQFRGKLGDEERYVTDTRAHIIEMQADREWAMARYYDKKKHYGAARRYYKTLIDNYPRTPRAEQAQKRLQEIRGEPDTPPDHFAWLTGMFERQR
ncbi:MAG: tetratricopeptide repeat protein [Thermoguttaceae bacterium]